MTKQKKRNAHNSYSQQRTNGGLDWAKCLIVEHPSHGGRRYKTNKAINKQSSLILECLKPWSFSRPSMGHKPIDLVTVHV
ncbi:hypothetical protein JTE90_008219 [Oedothorax gibbosus]|uniref:Uncharacterized protein n=1 Tax=Oedothorax gibbosus TaxID=931172 RepID=A0AAV6TP72_9ARAC|nr:hypothetical protein JTE90_008219 [Oedothorax gibbosus]